MSGGVVSWPVKANVANLKFDPVNHRGSTIGSSKACVPLTVSCLKGLNLESSVNHRGPPEQSCRPAVCIA
jgi:hypothetical protein